MNSFVTKRLHITVLSYRVASSSNDSKQLALYFGPGSMNDARRKAVTREE